MLSQSHLNVPVSVPQAVQTQLVSDLGGVHCIWQILLVGEDQQNLKKGNKLSLVVEASGAQVFVYCYTMAMTHYTRKKHVCHSGS